MKREIRWQKLVIRWGLVGIALLAASLWLSFRAPMGERPIPFESARWIATPAEFSHESIRQRMVDDLLRSHPLVGRSRAEVESLIGPPDVTAYFREYDMVYMLGQQRNSFLAIDSEWLVIKLDALCRVTEARLVTD